MLRASKYRLLLSLVVGGVISAALTLSANPPADQESDATPTELSPTMTVDEAREQARLLQTTYEATLHVIHRRYFDADEKQMIPAKALEDVFRLVDEETGRTTRWIAVSTP